MSSWLATLTFAEMFLLSLAVILAICAAYYLIPILRAKSEAVDRESYDPRWMDYQKWKETNI